MGELEMMPTCLVSCLALSLHLLRTLLSSLFVESLGVQKRKICNAMTLGSSHGS